MYRLNEREQSVNNSNLIVYCSFTIPYYKQKIVFLAIIREKHTKQGITGYSILLKLSNYEAIYPIKSYTRMVNLFYLGHRLYHDN